MMTKINIIYPIGHVLLMQKYYKSLTWSSYDLPRVLEERGVHDADKLPGFHYRDDALRLWQIIKKYVTDILKVYYHSDNDIKKVRLTLFLNLATSSPSDILSSVTLVKLS